MDLAYSEEYERLREAVRVFLKGWPLRGEEASLPIEEQEALFRKRGIEAGFVYRGIPKEYGGSGQEMDVLKDQIIIEEFYKAGAPRDLSTQGAGLLAPTLIEFGTEEQKRRYVPPALTGEEKWCQGYSEPGSGSDLASLQCQARLEGGEWVLNGQKIWTSSAQRAQMMFGMFRTEPEAKKKHEGISYLLVPMDTPGVEVRPLREMSGGFEFNEVFFTEARIPAENIVGKRGQGWQISRATLVHERNLIGNPFFMRESFDNLVELARTKTRNGRPAIEDPSIRQRIAEIEGYVRTSETSNMRQITAATRGEMAKVMRPVLMNKIYSTDTSQRIVKCAYDLLCGDGALAPLEEELEGWGRRTTDTGWVLQYIFSLGPAIAGGASNIQLNIIGERGYGLPRDRPRSR